VRALKFCLGRAGVGLEDVAAVAINWNLDAYTDGRMQRFYEAMASEFAVDDKTVAWQRSRLQARNKETTRRRHEREWQRHFGRLRFPPLVSFPHHYTHAFHAFMQSPFQDALTLTIDGSGDHHTTVLWSCRGDAVE